MSIIKALASWSPAFDQPAVQIVNLSSRGLLGLDHSNFVKRASADLCRDIDAIRSQVTPHETLIHLLAIGATEDYGPNRNGDGFKRAACRQYHPTFVKYAKFYRNHANKDPSKSYGRVIKSAFNEPMKRVELLVALNNDSVAAKANNGLIADRELEKLASGKEIQVSMACRVPFDICSYCGNEAPSTAQYCDSQMCKAGGLRENIGSLVEVDGGIHHLHADNTRPVFFDISDVFRGADRIARVTGMFDKVAAAGRIIKSAELARSYEITAPYELAVDGNQPRHVQQLIKLAYELAALEERIPTDSTARHLTLAFTPTTSEDTALPLPPLAREKFACTLRALADQQICLPFVRFIELVADQPFEKAAEIATIGASELPGSFNRLISMSDLPEKIKHSQYLPSDTAPAAFAGWATKLAADFSLAEYHVNRRVNRSLLNSITPGLRSVSSEKMATDRGPVTKLADEYALYKLAFLSVTRDLPLTRSLLVVQNYAD